MLQKYADNFAALTPEETTKLAVAVANRYEGTIGPMGMCSPDGQHLFKHVEEAGLSQADVVMAMAPDPTPEGVVILEKLIGRPIVRAAAPAAKAPRAPRSAAPRGPAKRGSDPRVVTYVGPNPKKEGSASHARFALYKEGMTVDQFVAAGGTIADVKWDSERGFIKLEVK